MATKKKTPNLEHEEGIGIAQDLVDKIGNLYAVLDEMAGNSNYLPDIHKSLERIAVALEKISERSNT